MARYNEIESGRFNRGVQKLFSMKGGAPAPQLSSEIMVVHPLLNGAENRYLEGWARNFFSWTIGPAAGFSTTTQVRNPGIPGGVTPNQFIIAVIEKICFSVIDAGARNIVIGQERQSNPDLTSGGLSALGGLDVRTNPLTGVGTQKAISSLLWSSSTTVNQALINPQLLGQYNLAAQTTQDVILFEDQEITLLPGMAMQINNVPVNISLTYFVIWRERFLEDSERS